MQYNEKKDIPIWTIIGNYEFITFQHEEESKDESHKWLLGEKRNREQVVAFPNKEDDDKDKDKGYTMHVYHVTSMSANDIPYIVGR